MITKYISLLRGINVSGQKKIKMDALSTLYESLGLKNVKTYIQSGNVIFESEGSNPAELVNLIENKIEQTFGFFVKVLIRSKEEIQKVLEKNPFYGERKEDISKLHVTFLSEVPEHYSLKTLDKFINSTEEFFISGREIYLFCPNGYGRTKLTNNLFEKNLKVSATTRNLKTVNKLYELFHN